MKLFMRITGLFLLLTLMCGGCTGKSDTKKPVTSIQQLNDPAYTIAVSVFGAQFMAVQRDLPKAKVSHVDGQAAYDALRMGKVDAYAFDRAQMEIAIADGLKGVKLLPGSIGDRVEIAVGLSPASKIDGIEEKINKFIAEIRASGILDDMYLRWVVKRDNTMPAINVPEKSELKLRVGTSGQVMPYNYYDGTTLTGYDVEFARRFASWLGAEVELRCYTFDGLIAAAATGEIDCIMADLNVTPERAEKINFSDVLFTEESALMVRDYAPEASAVRIITPAYADEVNSASSIYDFDGKRIGTFTGSVHDEIVREVLPNAKLSYFDGLANSIAALEAGRIDAIATDNSTIMEIEHANPSLKHIDGCLKTFDNAFILAKTRKADKIRSELDEFIRSMRADGTLQRLRSLWEGTDENAKTLPDYTNYPDINGTLRIAADAEAIPFTYIKDGKMTGYDVDIITRFCKAGGYKPEVISMNFTAIIPAVLSGRAEIGISAITITPERAESVNFTESVYTGGTMLLVKKTPEEMTAPESPVKFRKIADLNGRHIGAYISSESRLNAIRTKLPDSPLTYYDTTADFVAALETRKIDAFPLDVTMINTLMAHNKNVDVIDEVLNTDRGAGIAFPKTSKGRKLQAQWNEYITSMQESGKLEAMLKKWTGSDESAKTIIDYSALPAPNGVLVTATNGTAIPYSYYKDGKLAGLEVDLAASFCEAYGYGLKFIITEFSGILAAIASGKCDFGVASLEITEERAEQLLFSIPYHHSVSKMVVRAGEVEHSQPTVIAEAPKPEESSTKFEAFRGKKIGVQTGEDGWRDIVLRTIPDAQIVYYENIADLAAALESRKIDAFTENSIALSLLMSHNKNITVIDEPLEDSYRSSAAFAKTEKGAKLKAQFDEYITAMKADGRMKALMDKWTGEDESAKTLPDYASFPAPNGVITLVTDGNFAPMSYYRGTQLVGAEVDLAARFCEAYGYGLKLLITSFPGFMPAVKSGKADFNLGAKEMTEERAENFLFSVPYYEFAIQLAVLAETMPSSETTQPGKFSRISDLNGRKIGVGTGVEEWAKIAHKLMPDSPIIYYNTTADLVSSLESGKIDAFPIDTPALKFLMAENKNIAALDELFEEGFSVGVVFSRTAKGEKFKSQWDKYIISLRDSGKLDALAKKWENTFSENTPTVNYAALPAINGTVRMASYGEYPPLSYYTGTKLTGLEIELAAGFCEAYGYALEIKDMAYDAIIPSVNSGRSDFGLGCFGISDEHAESVLFSEPYYFCSSMMAIRAKDKAANTSPAPAARGKRFAELSGKRIGIQSGVTEWIDIVNHAIPNAQISYYNTYADMTAALRSRKIDAFVCDTPVLQLIMSRHDDIADFGELLEDSIDVAVAMPKNAKGRALKAEWDEFITRMKREGRLESLIRKWTGTDDSAKTLPNYAAFPATRGVLTMATEGEDEPFNYYRGTEITGFEMDLAAQFCEAYGYGLNVKTMTFDAIMPSLVSGKCDFALELLALTDEHAESVLFSVPYYACATSIAVLKTPESRATFSGIQDLAGKRIGVATGTTHAEITAKFVPAAQLVYFDTPTDVLTALKAGKIDAACTAIPILRDMMTHDDTITPLGEQLTFVDCAPVFPKTEAGKILCEKFSEFAKACWDNGTIKAMDSMWFEQEESRRVMKDYSHLPSPNGTLRVAVDESFPPFVYMKDNRIVGYDIDFAARFCEAYGYGLEVRPVKFSGIIPAVMSGKCDFGIGSITITDERKESVLFSYPNAKTGNIFAVRKTDRLAGKRIGVQTGTNNAQTAARFFPNAEIVCFDSRAELLTALKLGKIDAVCLGWNTGRFLVSENKDLAILDGPLAQVDAAPVFAKTDAGRKLCTQYSEFITALRNNGTLQALNDIWFGGDNSKRTLKDYSNLPAPNGVLKMAVDTSHAPAAYVKDNKIIGYEIDCAVRFCEAYGYGLEVVPMNFGAVIPAVLSGKCDFGACNISITPERSESVLFSAPNMTDGDSIVIRKFDALTGKRIGVQTGTTHPQIAAQFAPSAQLVYFDSTADVFTALKAGKIDVVCTNTPIARFVMLNDDSVTMLGDELVTMDCSPVFPKTAKGEKLREEFSAFIKASWEDGTIREIDSIWFGRDERRRIVKDYTKLPAPNGVLKMATDPSLVPFAYMKNNRIVGYEVDFAVRFCEAYGYGLEVVPMNFGAIIPALQSGRYDFAACSIAYTPERAENVLYADSHLKSGYAFFVRQETQKQPAKSHGGVEAGLKSLSGRKIGIILGANHDEFVTEKIPDAKIEYFSDLSTITLALKAGKIDAFANTLPTAVYMTHEHKDISYIAEPLESTYTYSSFTNSDKGRKLCREYEAFLQTLWNDGTINRLADKWVYGEDESARTLDDYSKLPAVNGVLKMAVDTGRMPFAYVKDNKITGYDIELASMFCKAKGYGLEVIPLDFGGIIGSIKAGKCDLTGSITWTEERAENMLYSSVPNAQTDIVLLVMKNATPAPVKTQTQNISDLAGKRVAVQVGTNLPEIVASFVPTAKLEYFDTQADLVTALKAGKVDAFCTDIPVARFMMSAYDGMEQFGDTLTVIECAPIFPKTDAGKALCDKFSEFTKLCWEDGTIKQLEAIWYGQDDSKRVVKDYSQLPAPNGKLRMAADTSTVPFAYVKDNKIVGYDVDFAVRFCEKYGYGLEVIPMNFSAVIPALKAGKCDFAADSITITPERAENVFFSEPNVKSGTAFFVRKSDVKRQEVSPARGKYTSIQELAGKKIGVQVGTTNERLVAESIPTATREYFNTLPDALLALKTGKVDAICCSIYAARYMMIENDDITYLENMLTELDLVPIFSPTDKGRRLREEYSEFIKGLWADGTIQEIDSVWLGKDDSRRVLKDYSRLPAPNGVLKMAAEPTDIPFVYMKDNRFVGYDVDIAVRFCESHGYGLEIVPMSFSAVISSIRSGKTDFSASMHKTPEREQSALFASVSTAHSGNVIVVMKAQTAPAVEEHISEGEYTSPQELAGKRIGAQTGTPNGDAALKVIPTATIDYFDSVTDLVTALKMRKIDAASMALNAARFMLLDNEDLVFIDKPLNEYDAAPIFPKTPEGKALCDKFNEFIKAQWDNGYLQELDSIWFSRDDSRKTAKDYSSLPATNGKLRMAVDLSLAPFAYVMDNKIVGYEIDFAVKFCKEYGYGLEVIPMNFGAIIAAVQSGKCDFASCTIAVLPERAEQVLFASPNAKTGNILVVRRAAPRVKAGKGQYTTLDEVADKRIGVQTGTVSAMLVEEKLPNAKIEYFDALSDILIALKTGRIDALACTIFSASHMVNTNDEVTYMDQWLKTTDISPIFTSSDRGRKLCSEYSDFVKALWDDGTIDRLNSVWLGSDESKKVVKDYTNLPATNGVIRLAVDPSMPPLAYVRDNRVVGYDVDLAVRFCEAKGYGLEIVQGNISSVLAEVMSGKCDLSLSVIYTEERAQSALYPSTPTAHSGNVVVVLKDKPAPVVNTAPAVKQETVSPSAPEKPAPEKPAAPSRLSIFMEDARVFMDDLKASFNRTFLREERWRLFVEGIINTMIITVLSILCGTVLGFVVYLMCRGGNVIANLLTRFSVWLIQGTPMVVLLMILYYIIFGKVDINGMWVAVIAFSLTFGSAVYGMLRSGTGALDIGQTEAAYALGFSDRQTFFRVILPQAALHFMPAYKAEVVALIKATAIVGYIAVQDLTKMGDIVRSRTYEAFFPLIAVAVIYFVLAGILNLIVGVIHNRIRPEKRTRDDILRGIDTHD